MSEPGTPDIALPSVPGWLEIKTKTGKLSDVQKSWHSKAKELGVNVATVRSAQEAIETVQSWITNK